MRILVAPDSFKECLSSVEVCRAIELGLRRALPQAELVSVPMADGGEGTLDALVASTSGRIVPLDVRGPLGDRVRARFGLSGDGKTAVIEMAEAAGLHLVPVEERNPGIASTFGVGELIGEALNRGVDQVVVGLGGSATNDGGAGMAQALGFSLRDEGGEELAPGGLALAGLATIDGAKGHAGLKGVEFVAACDVDNPLCGARGASRVYGPQKGASPELVARLDEALGQFGEVVRRTQGVEVLNVAGAGAAGGLGAGLMAFVGGRLRGGVDVVAEACDLAGRMAGAELVITGEGRVDGQSVHGKTPVGVARIAKKQGIPVVAFAGSLGEDYRAVYAEGVDAVFSICPGPLSVKEAIDRAEELLANTAESFARGWHAARGRFLSGVE